MRIETGGLNFQVLALLDTGAPYCILNPELGEQLRPLLGEGLEQVPLSTREGRKVGTLYKASIKLVAEEGSSLEFEPNVFLCDDWPHEGRNFLGYDGCLEYLRFAVDPAENQFYFGVS